MSKIVKLEKGGHIKTMTERSYKLLGKSTDGYRLVTEGMSYPLSGTGLKSELKELTREQMVEALKSKGINVHHNLGDAKLKERYEIEIRTNQ